MLRACRREEGARKEIARRFQMSALDPARLVFIDEAAVTTKMTRYFAQALSVSMIGLLSEALQIPPEILIRPYDLQRAA